MPARCQVCAHPDLTAIHAALLAGTPRRRVARLYGLEHNAMDRHWAKHVPESLRTAAARAQAEAGPVTLDALSSDVLLGQAGEVYERAVALSERLEADMSKPGAKVDTRSVVAALREVRQSLEMLAKLSFAVQDRPSPPQDGEHPAIDAAIIAALRARDVPVDEDEAQPADTRNADGTLRALPAPANPS